MHPARRCRTGQSTRQSRFWVAVAVALIAAVTPAQANETVDDLEGQVERLKEFVFYESPSAIDENVVLDIAHAPGVGLHGATFALTQGRTGLCADAEPCLSLFRSIDGGASWERLVSGGLGNSWEILIAPGYPIDNRIFLVGTPGLRMSTDGGRTFDVVAGAPGTVPPAMSPDFSNGDERIVFGYWPGLVYDASLGISRPLLGVPPQRAESPLLHPAFAPHDSSLLFIGGTVPDATPYRKAPAVFRCVNESCAEHVRVGVGFSAEVFVSRSFEDDATVFVLAGNRLHRSTDGGRTFAQVGDDIPYDVLVFAEDDAGTLYAVGRDFVYEGTVYRSTDRGLTWVESSPVRPPWVPREIFTAGRVLYATPIDSAESGLWCSRNQGVTWSRRCPG